MFHSPARPGQYLLVQLEQVLIVLLDFLQRVVNAPLLPVLCQNSALLK